MRYGFASTFRRDWARLPSHERELVRAMIRPFNTACNEWCKDPGRKWPDALRVKPLKGNVNGAWEVTWSFRSPDGRATFHFEDDGDGLRVVWRRIGYHEIFAEP